jgi:predicted nucleic acid-binding protein
MRHGLDTSILVAYEADDHPQHADSEALVRQCLSNGDDFALARQLLAELIHILADKRRFTQP